MIGFVGCLRNIIIQKDNADNVPVACTQNRVVDTNQASYSRCIGDIGLNTCSMEDR